MLIIRMEMLLHIMVKLKMILNKVVMRLMTVREK